MKVIAGKYKNSKIASELNGISPQIKPTTSKVRDAVFNVIFSYLEKNGKSVDDCSFLDICCGTGAMGVEAISRGFSSVYFVDKNKECIALAKHNLLNICKNDEYKLINSDILKLQITEPVLFDIIYIDPPYDNGSIIWPALSYIKQFTHEKSLILVETAKKLPAVIPNEYNLTLSKSYGNCMVHGFLTDNAG